MSDTRAEQGKKLTAGAGRLASWLFVLLLGAAFVLSAGAAAAPAAQGAQGAKSAKASAQSAGGPPTAVEGAKEANHQLDSWVTELDRIDKQLKRGKGDEEAYNKLRDRLEAVRRGLDEFVQQLGPRLKAAQEQLAKLGPPPGEGEPAEPAAAAMERKNLKTVTSTLKSFHNTSEALRVRSGQILSALQERRRELFTGGLTERARPLTQRFWRDVSASAPGFQKRLESLLDKWWNRQGDHSVFLFVGLLCLASWGVIFIVCRNVIIRLRSWYDDDSVAPPLWRRAASAAWVIILRATPIASAAGLFYVCITGFDLVAPEARPIAYALALAMCAVAVVSSLVATLLEPREPRWRIFPASDRAARRIHALTVALACVYGVDLVLEALLGAGSAPEQLYMAKSLIADLVFGVLLVVILLAAKNGVAHHDEEAAASRSPWILFLRLPLWGAAIAILASTLTGHVAFARFLSAQVVVTTAILVIVYLLLIWTEALNHAIVDDDTPLGRRFGAKRLDQRRRKQIALPIRLGLQALIVVAAVPLVLLQWGFDQKDVRDWFEKAFFGFQLGKIVISPATIIGAGLVFAVGYIAAQFFRNWIDRQVLAPAGMTGGARDSIRTGVGYLGVTLAAVLAFSYIGVDSSHIALIAGALSLGIGFGLQSIVNNFVSGLILLAERPIKVGDWIVVHGEEGFVRRISVRTTEVETFDHHSVIVPNSVLISEQLRNCTLHNNRGRLSITVGVSYDSDPEVVRDILLKVAGENPRILSWPEPFVYFVDFGSSSMDFKLYAYLSDVVQHYNVRTELRIAIWKAFREAGVEIPFNQHDIHLRDLDWIKSAVARRITTVREASAEARPDHAPAGGETARQNADAQGK
jgi:potassium efflux system protein